MDQDVFFKKVLALLQRTTKLWQSELQGEASQSPLTSVSLEEMQTAIEELRVADEEIRRQNEEVRIAYQALERERRRYQELFDFAPDGYIVTDLAGIVQETNQAAQALLQESSQGLVGKPLVIYIAQENRQAFYALLQSLSQDQETRTWEACLQPRTHRSIPVSLTVALMRDPAEGVYGLLWLLRDITLQVQLTEQLRTLNVGLETRVQERTADLRRSNEELMQFAYVASHDLQEPLRVITTYIQLLAKRYQNALDAEAEEFIGYVVDGAQRMHRLIQDLLAYSRLQTTERKSEKIPSEQILMNVINDLHETIADTGAVVTHDPLPVVLADASQLGRVFQNLLSNACKFRSKLSPHIHVSAVQEGDKWLFSVRDNGIGLDPQHAERIFVIFQRLHTQREYPGTGMGLAICKKILEQHGGRIWVQSTPGTGSTFYFTLPISAPESDA
jgi:PAS domain S-box-containing protein